MEIKDLEKLLKENKLEDINFENYKGNSIFSLKNLDIADVDIIEGKTTARLQLNK